MAARGAAPLFTCAMGQARVQEPGPCPEWPSALDSQQWPRGSWEVPPSSFSRAHVRLRLCSCKGTVAVGPLGQGGPCCPPRGPSLCLVSCTAQVPERTEAAAAHKRLQRETPRQARAPCCGRPLGCTGPPSLGPGAGASGNMQLPPPLTFQESCECRGCSQRSPGL